MRFLGAVIVVAMLTGLSYLSMDSYLNMPIVQMSNRQNAEVACITPKHGEKPITSAVCQEVLKGRYEVEWVP